ncbi:MAG: phage holin family protein [Patescibacteria group bacterium]
MLKKFFLGIVLNGASLYGVIYLLPKDIIYTGGLAFFVLGGLVMGLLNSIVKPVLKLLTLPLQIITLGLSLILLNGIIFWIFDVIIDTMVIKGITIQVNGIATYALAGLLFGLINWIEHLLIRNK